MDIEKLEKRIIDAAQAYYEGKTDRDKKLYGFTDAEFDLLVEKLRKVSPDNPLLSTPGWGYIVDPKRKVQHIGSTVGSLDKIKYPEPVPASYNYYNYDVIITPKLDGGSIVLYYHNGRLTDALTRGNGSIGMSCLKKMRYLTSNVKVTENGLVSIRGEVVIPNSYHADLTARGIPNPRNYANGVINRIEADEDIKMLRFIPYTVRIYNRIINKGEMIELLSSWGFKRIPYREGSKDLKQLFEHWSEKFPIDGLVITRNNTKAISLDRPEAFTIEEDAIAYKFESERAQVTVGSIEWQVGDTGRIIPVIKLSEPVFLSGANIVSITAHNATQVKKKGIGEGAKITIERANSVIPYLVSVDSPSDKVELPEYCPDCKKPLEWKDMDLYCSYQYCPTKQMAIIKSILEVCGIPEGFGDKLLEKWVNGGTVYDVIENAHSGRIPIDSNHSHYEKLEAKLMDNLYKKFKKGFTYQEFWKMIRIQGLGDSASKKLKHTDPRKTENFNSLNLPSNVIDELDRTYDFWSIIAKDIPFIEHVEQQKEIKMSVVITGPVSMPRKKFEDMLEDNGVEVKKTVNKKTTYLICNDTSTNSDKIQDALKLGIPILDETTFLNTVGMVVYDTW
jgi:DNA ligase (NAD+)